jgi:hypothetical protein
MNRFYKPTPREYVSTSVDMPWEFLQGVAEQKQKGYDTALSTSDAAANLLNFEVIPGDTEAKKAIQKKYNDRILQAQSYVQQTGDFNKASRDLAGIVRDIAQDPYINTMKAAVPVYKEQRKSFDEMKQKGEIRNWWESDFDYMYSTVDKDGNARPYNQNVGVKTADFHKAATDSFGKLNMFKNEFGRTVFIDKDGIKRDITEGGGSIVVKDIEARAKSALPAYRNTDAYANHKLRAQKELERGVPELVKAYEEKGYQAIIDRADALGYENMVSTNLDQLASERKYVQKDDILTADQREALGLGSINPSLTPGPNTSLVTQPYKPIGISTFETVGTQEQINAAMSGQKPKGMDKTGKFFLATNFNQIPSEYRNTFEKLYKQFKGNAAYEDVKAGKQSLTEDELQQFTAIFNSLNKGLRTNTSTAPIGTKPAQISAKHGELFGVPEELVKADVLTKGPAGYSPSTKVYDTVEGEWTTFGEIEKGSKEKPFKYRVNMRYTTQNPLYMLSGNDKRFVKGYSLISENGAHQYIIPEKENNVSQLDELQAQLGSAVYSEGVPARVELLSTEDKNVFSMYEKGAFSLMTIDPETGVPEYYTGKDGKPVVKSSATDMQNWILENTPK